jgi:hypothetical protein
LRVSPILDLPSDPPGTVDLTAVGNRISGAAKYGIMLHARGTVQPCALNPNCPPPPHPDYLRNSRYDLLHTGELNNALIDNPELHPFDHVALQNTLIVNNTTIGHGTFVVVPALLARPAGLR